MIEILYFDSDRAKGGFIGNFGVKIPEWNNMEIRGLALIRNKEGKRFVMMPNKKKLNGDKWELEYNYLQLPREIHDKFSASCIQAIDIDAKKAASAFEPVVDVPNDNDLPF